MLMHERDAIVKVTLASICSSDLHIKHGSVPRAVPGITVGHEMVGIVEAVGSKVTHVKPGDRVTVNVETFCGECFSVRRICKQLYRQEWWLGTWLSYRWGTARICPGSFCRSGIE